MRCPACGATNSDRAEWCTQCFRDLRARLAPEPVDGVPAPGATEADPADVPGAGAAPSPVDDAAARSADEATPRPADGAQRDVRTVDGEVEWRCPRCEGWSSLVSSVCTTCGAPRHGFGEVAPPPALDPAARTRLLAATAVLPGLGHLLARRTGTGLARLILAVTWLLGAVLVASGSGSALPAAPLLLGVATLWAGSLRDVLTLVDGGREVLTSRVLLWLTGAVLLTLLGTLTVSTGGAGSG